MEDKKQLLLFRIDGKLLAADISSVVRVLKAVFITPMPDAPRHIRGVIRYADQVIPVIDVSVKMGGIQKNINLTDCLIILKNGIGTFALLVNYIEGITTGREITGSETVIPKGDIIKGIAVSGEEIIFLGDSEKLFIDSDRILTEEFTGKDSVKL